MAYDLPKTIMFEGLFQTGTWAILYLEWFHNLHSMRCKQTFFLATSSNNIHF